MPMYLGFAFECLALLVFFYVYFCNRLAYTFLNAGLYLAVIMQIGRGEPLAAAPEGWADVPGHRRRRGRGRPGELV